MWPLFGLGLVKLLLHLLTASRYGFHRDEFYYVAGGQHLAWGFVDHPPVTPLLALVGTELFGMTPLGVRVLSALAGAATVALAGLLARELGGGRFAQMLAALMVLCTPFILAASSVMQTVPLDLLWWTLAAYGVVRAVRTGSLLAWLGTGLVLGIALMTKYTVLLFGFGLLVGLVASARAQLKTPGPWAAALVAFAVFLPNVLWQIAHGWPTLEFIANNSANADMTLGGFLAMQPLLLGLPSLSLWLGGLVWFFSSSGRPYRVLGWTVLTTFGVLLLVGGKAYYLGATYPMALAAGAVGLESLAWVQARQWVRPTVLAVIAGLTLPFLPLFVPVLPVDTMVRVGLHEVNGNYAEMLGWPDLVETITEVYDGLPPEEQATTVIFTGNYGEAGALNLLGPSRLPRAVSGHNSVHDWGPPPDKTTTVIALGFGENGADYLRRFFAEVEPVATVTNSYGVENEEFGGTVWLCRGLAEPLSRDWANRYHYD